MFHISSTVKGATGNIGNSDGLDYIGFIVDLSILIFSDGVASLFKELGEVVGKRMNSDPKQFQKNWWLYFDSH